jgi:hypothetical protein
MAANLPFKLYGIWLIAKGHVASGVATILAAKLIGTMFLTRLFTICSPKLRRIGWFAALYDRFLQFHTWISTWFHTALLWRVFAPLLTVFSDYLCSLRRTLHVWAARLHLGKGDTCIDNREV